MSDFRTYIVKDDRLNVKDSLAYEVYKGGQNVTFSNIQSTSASVSQHVFNVIVPSQNVLVDRNIHWESTINCQFTLTSARTDTDAYYPPRWAHTVGVQAFPLNQLCTTMTATINNNSVSIQSRDIMPFLLKLFSNEELSDYQNTTPAMPDNYQKYADQFQKASNVLGGSENMTLDGLQPRGAFKLNYYSSIAPQSWVLPTDRWHVEDVSGSATPVSQTIYFSLSVSEPLFLSPFLYTQFARNQAGIYGINNMNITMNMGDSSQFLKCPFYSTGVTDPVTNDVISNVMINYNDEASLRIQYLTPHASENLQLRNIVPYYTLNRFTYKNGTTIAGATITGDGNASIVQPSTFQIQSNVINVNQIPDRFIIGVRPTAQFYNKPRGIQHSQFFFPVQNFTCNWNNNSGLLASSNNRQLWHISVNNGLKQSWQEWSGVAMSSGATAVGSTGASMDPLLGGFLVLSPGKDIQIQEDWYSCGSIGNFQFQCTITCENYSKLNFESGDVELVIIPMNSGLFVLQQGTSSLYQAILTKELVVEATRDKNGNQARFSSEVTRQIGGNFFDDIKTGLNEVSGFVKPITDIVGPIASVAKMLAAGESGGGASGGGVSGGKKSRHMRV